MSIEFNSNNGAFPTKSRPGTEATRQRIIEAAIRLFSEKGYAGATTRAIAAEAGVNEVTIFRHFGNKENLLRLAIDSYSILPGLERMLEEQMTGDYGQDLLHLAKFLMARLSEPWQMTERRKILLMMLREVEQRPEMRGIVLPLFCNVRQLLRSYLGQQIERGELRDLDPDVVAEAIMGIFFSHVLLQPMLAAASVCEGLPPEELAAKFVDIFMVGTVNHHSPGKT